MQIRQTTDGTVSTLHLEGRFDFHSHRDFRAATDTAMQTAGAREIVINFSRVDYIDSSALGMLLLLREKAEAAGKQVTLTGLQGTAKQVLEVANFSKLFTIKG